MAKIIRFPVREQESVAYGNYTQLIEAALSKETLNFYMECIEESEKKGHFLERESEKLLEQGRKRRLEMAKPVQTEKEVAESPGVYCLLYTRDGTAEARLPDGSIKRLLWQTLVHRYPVVFKRKRDYIFKKVYR